MLRLVPCLALGAILMIGGCDDSDGEARTPDVTGGWSTAGCELARQPESITVGGLTLPSTPAELEAAMGRIDRAGHEDFHDSYAGLEVDQKHVRAVVYRVPSAGFDDFIGARHDGSGVEVGTQDPDRARLELPARYGSRAPFVIVDQGPVRPLG
jgi:hypothetical protein